MTLLQLTQNLCAALGLGCVIGLERQLTGHSIGIRTGVLVCMGAALFTSFPFCIPDGDVTRMAAQIISGVGFLGSGIIFKDGYNVRGINTAATIWCTAGIGILAGAGLYLYAIVATLGLTVVNLILRLLSSRMERWHFPDESGRLFRLCVTCPLDAEGIVRKKMTALLSNQKTELLSIGRRNTTNGMACLEARFFYEGSDYAENNEKIARELSAANPSLDMEWELADR